MGIGTFGSFTQARLAIYAAQSGLTVTGNNIANINTDGYTRQRLDQESLYIGGADRYVSRYDLRIGQGVLSTGVSQLRNPYLDIRYRTEMAKVGYMDTMLGGLEGLKSIIDEVGKGEQTEGEDFGVLASQLEELETALRNLTTETGHQEYDIQVRSAAEALAAKLNAYATKLQEHYENVEKGFVQDVSEVNTILSTIRDLNESIRNSEIHGEKALELRDERNLQIDKLAEYMQIDVKYVPEDIGGGEWVEKLVIKLGDANPDATVKTDSTVLIDGIFGAQLSIEQVPELREYNKKDPTSLPYLDKNGQPTSKLADAQMIPKTNDDGDMVNDKGEVVTNPDDAMWVPEKNPGYIPYLTPDGEPTADPEKARQVNNPNFNLTVSELRDCRENLLYNTVAKTEEIDKAAYDAAAKKVTEETDPDTGIITMKVYGQKVENGKRTYFCRTYTKTPSEPVELDDNDLYGALQAERELLTEAGEFTDLEVIKGTGDVDGPYRNADENASSKRGILYYQRSLDLLANQLATAFNKANQGYYYDKNGDYISAVTDGNGEPVLGDDGMPLGKPITIGYTDDNGDQAEYALNKFVNYDDPKVWDALPQEVKDTLTALDQSGTKSKSELVEAYLAGQSYDANGNPTVAEEDLVPVGIFVGGNLFSNNGDTNDDTDITASNISISYDWSKGDMIIRSFQCGVGHSEPATGASENILHLQGLFQTKMDYRPTDLTSCGGANSDAMFNGTFGEMQENIMTVLGKDQKQTTDLLNTYYKTSVDIDTSRDSVSSVDFNDEAMNLMMYAKSYNAACRLMTTIDSVLDKLVNGTGMTT